MSWSGAWNLLDLYMFEKSIYREMWYIAIGVAGLLVTNSYISNAGLGVVKIRTWNQRDPKTRWEQVVAFTRIYLRCFIAFLSSMIFWVGCYNMIDLYLFYHENSMVYIDPRKFWEPTKDVVTIEIGRASCRERV